MVPGVAFPITIYVTNNSSEAKTFNRVAAGYALADFKIKGPYELDTTQRTLAPGASTNFTVNFRILYGTGTIVPVAVFFAQNSYQDQNMRGGGIFAIKVYPSPSN